MKKIFVSLLTIQSLALPASTAWAQADVNPIKPGAAVIREEGKDQAGAGEYVIRRDNPGKAASTAASGGVGSFSTIGTVAVVLGLAAALGGGGGGGSSAPTQTTTPPN